MNKKIYKYAFIVHPRDLKDIYKKFGFLKYLPDFIVYKILNILPAIKVSKITGLKSVANNSQENIDGYIISIPITAEMMLKNKENTVNKIVKALEFAKRLNCKIGLGGLTSSLSNGGLLLKDRVKDISITTGHAYTGYNVTNNIFALAEKFNLNIKEQAIAIVGATGSIGTISAEILARAGVKKLILIDIDRKKERFENILSKIQSQNENCEIEISTNMFDIQKASMIITATNAKEALIKTEHVKSGHIIVDDAQPSDVHMDVLHRKDVLVVEAGVVHTPNIHSNFNLGLKNREDNFCCMAELLVLASHKHEDHYVIHRASLKDVDRIIEMSKDLNFRLGDFQNRYKKLGDEDFEGFRRFL